jgi:hypothetical protein
MKLLILMVFVGFLSCKKSSAPDPVSAENKAKATAFTTLLQKEKFQLKKYYSDVPIDYIDTDQVVKAETELWPYVSGWLKDDAYVFKANGDLVVEQNAVRIPSDTSALLMRTYTVKPDKDGVAFKFLGHEYQVLDYRLVTFNDTSLVIWATWNNKKVFSEFRKVN